MNSTPSPRPSPAERLAAFLLLLFCAVPLLLVALVILVTGGRPLLVSRDLAADAGSTRLCYRFRTSGPGTAEFPIVGQFLRKYFLDQLPTLWNVVCGDLKLKSVWPRTD